MDELVIIPDVTRFKDGKLNFVVKSAVENETDMWWVLPTNLMSDGYWPRSGSKKPIAKLIKMSSGQIRMLHARSIAEDAHRGMETQGLRPSIRAGRNRLTVIERFRIQKHAGMLPDAKKTSRLALIKLAQQKVLRRYGQTAQT